MTITSTENVRVGFFSGKASRIVNIKQMQEFICTRLSPVLQSEIPPFQLIHNTLGQRDPATRSKAVMVECFRRDAGILSTALETVFSPNSKYPFISFQVFYHLSDQAKHRYYREHKNRTDSESIIEIPFPSEFQQLDTVTQSGISTSTLRHFLFDYKIGRAHV
jgi:hypothetical protein